ncbi:DNA binding domain, excisionase family [Mycobacteroides abscessus subsp. abscessus]|nr:DNA binding domain, excisionase family [Mycobacteroides abscessus subsp. abscessus]
MGYTHVQWGIYTPTESIEMTTLEQAIEDEVQRRVAAALETAATVPVVYTVSEAARVLKVGRSTVYEMIRARELTPSAHPRKVLIPASEVARVLGLRDAA